MKKWWILSKALIKGSDTMGVESRKKKQAKKSFLSKSLDKSKKTALFALALVYIGFIFGMNGYLMADYFLEMGINGGNIAEHPEIVSVLQAVITQFYLPGFFMLLGLGFVYSAGIFFFAEDLNILLSLPLTPGTIVGAKIFNLYVYSVIMPAALALPATFILGFRLGMPLLYYFYALLVLLFGAMMPMCIDAILIMLLMRISALTKNKDRFMILVQLLMFIGIFAFVVTNTGNTDPANLKSTGLSSLIIYLAPLSDKAIEALVLPSAKGSALKIISFVALAAMMVAALILIAGKIYLKAAKESRSGGRAHKPMTDRSWRYLKKSKGQVANLMAREYKNLARSPVYLMNILLSPIIMIVIMLGSLIFTLSSQQVDITSLRAQILPMLTEGKDSLLPIAFSFICGIAAFVSSTNYCTATSISREGRGAAMLKSWPVSIKSVFAAKLLLGQLISFAIWLPLIVISFWLLPFSFYFHPLFVILLLFLPAAINVTGLLLDLRRPNLDWSSEQQVAKQNLNILFHMLAAIVYGGLLIGLALLAQKQGAGILIISLIFGGGSILLFVIALVLLGKYGGRYYLERVS